MQTFLCKTMSQLTSVINLCLQYAPAVGFVFQTFIGL